MSFSLAYRHKIPGLPIWAAVIEVDAPQDFHEYFPPTGFLYLNMYATAQEAPQAAAEALRKESDMTVRWKIAIQEGTCRLSQIVTGGILTQGPVRMDCCGRGRTAILVLHPMIAYHFLRERLDLLADGFADLSDLIGAEGAMFRPQIEDGVIRSWEDAPMQAFLHQRLGAAGRWQQDPVFHAVNQIISSQGRIRIRKLASDVCMSERSLERNFMAKVGVRPKVYANIWRFQHALRLLQQHRGQPLEEIAELAGYYDLSHFMKDLSSKLGPARERFLAQTPELLAAFMQVVRED
ncbi:MAG: helix-turn-helix domain-containing protein [Bacteroidia bacterium]|nr:helix-turn-helix domain-containing protein [Bacteroidia bacterium]